MIDIKIEQESAKRKGRLVASGHALTAPKGEDLVCCAVGVLIGALQSNLEATPGVRVSTKVQYGEGVLSWRCRSRYAEYLVSYHLGFFAVALNDFLRYHPKDVRLTMIGFALGNAEGEADD